MIVLLRFLCNLFVKNKVGGGFKNILLVRWDGKIGDSIVSSSLVQSLQNDPTKNLYVVTTKSLSNYYLEYLNLNDKQVFIIEKPLSLIGIYKLKRYLPEVDTVVHPVGYFRFYDLMMTLFLKPRNVFGLDDKQNFVNFKLGQLTRGMNFNDKYQYISSLLTKYIVNDYFIPQTKNNREIPEDTIVFNPFGSKKYRTFSITRSLELLSKISDAFPNKRIVILYSPSTKLIADEIKKVVNRREVNCAENIVTIYDAIEYIRSASLIISVDTAIVHISEGLKKNMVSIYPQQPDGSNPWVPPSRPNSKIIFGVRNIDNYFDGFSVVEVLESAKKLLEVKEQVVHEIG